VGRARPLLGGLIDTFARAWALLHVVRFRVLSRFDLMTLQQASECVARPGTFIGYRVRQAFYDDVLSACGRELEMNVGATIAEAGSRIGQRVWIGGGSYLDLVEVGDDVLIGPGVTVLALGGAHHRLDGEHLAVRRNGNNPLLPTRIGDGAWIGARAVVLQHVGRGAVVGAGAVVVAPVADFAIVAGNPARVVGTRPQPGDGG
jgi:acetyltransferase-like isoleucine patch superfamily enzyme